MFYSADKEAFGGWWFGGLFGVCLVLIVFFILFLRIKRQDEQQRYSMTSLYSKFVRSYKAECWFWEFVIFSRRFCISCFTAMQFVCGRYANFLFLILLMLFFGLQIQFKPFAFHRVNQVETVCLALLIAAAIAINVVREDDDDLFVSWTLSICMTVPLLIIAWAVYRTISASRALKSMNERDLHIDRMQKALRRNPKSLKDLLVQNTRQVNLKSLATTKVGQHRALPSVSANSLNSVEMSPYGRASSTLRNRKSRKERADFEVALRKYLNYDVDTLAPFHAKKAEICEMIDAMNEEPGRNTVPVAISEGDEVDVLSDEPMKVVMPPSLHTSPAIDSDVEMARECANESSESLIVTASDADEQDLAVKAEVEDKQQQQQPQAGDGSADTRKILSLCATTCAPRTQMSRS